MSNTDSFIEEVNEEVRRERLYILLKRYGWIAGIAILVLVGGTAWNEYRKAQAQNAAEARGDAINAALSVQGSPDARAEALSALAPNGMIEAFMAATEQQAAGDTEAASATLAALATQPEIEPLYRDLAQIKRLSADPTIDAEERALVLAALAAPGAPYRTIARELQALDAIALGETAQALEILQTLLQDAEASTAQRSRIAQLIIALGETPELANTLLGDTSALPAQ
ncbi:MAG: hypothetical protein AAF841_03585 [Pseudomonadota bacterium]